MKKITLLFAMLLFSIVGLSQCINGTAYGTYAAVNSGNSETVNTCTYGGEYNELSNLTITYDYTFTAEATGTPKYITITDAADVVIAFGPSPLSVLAITASDVRLHVTDDAACAITSSCHTTTIQCNTCVPPPPPANNDCANPIVLTPGGVFGTNSVVGTIVNSTDSGELATTCSSYGGGDVWYSVIVPADGNIDIETNNNSSTLTDTAMEVYSGTCGTLTSVGCDDDGSTDGNFSLVSLTGRTPGEVLLVRIWEYAGGTEDTFQVSAYNATLSIEDLKLSEWFKAYPNPVIDELTISAKNEIMSLSIVNMLGQTVRIVTPNSRNYKLDFADLSPGIYFVKASVNNTEGTIRIVKK
ncbi:MAG: hypothetical protein COA88_05615 [Kordia sp.]|nr:MAG: hypothetical protein COA88_05615 [Kordia sp.]